MPSFVPPFNDLVTQCQQMDSLIGVVLLAFGLVFMLMGVRIFRALVSLSYAALGLFIGLQLPVSYNMQWVCGGVAAVVLALASSFIMKVAVGLLAGGWAGFLVLGLGLRFGLNQMICQVAGGLVLILVASLALSFYHQIIAFVTSLEGSFLCLGGLVALLSKVPLVWQDLRSILVDNAIFGPFFVAAGTVIGFYFQSAETRQKESGMAG